MNASQVQMNTPFLPTEDSLKSRLFFNMGLHWLKHFWKSGLLVMCLRVTWGNKFYNPSRKSLSLTFLKKKARFLCKHMLHEHLLAEYIPWLFHKNWWSRTVWISGGLSTMTCAVLYRIWVIKSLWLWRLLDEFWLESPFETVFCASELFVWLAYTPSKL